MRKWMQIWFATSCAVAGSVAGYAQTPTAIVQPAAGSRPRFFITSDDIRAACIAADPTALSRALVSTIDVARVAEAVGLPRTATQAAVVSAVTARAQSVTDMCKLKDPNDEWYKTDLPTADEVRTVTAVFRASGMNLGLSEVIVTGASGPSVASAITTATGVIESRAEKEFNEFVVAQFADHLCSYGRTISGIMLPQTTAPLPSFTIQVKDLLPNTCSLLVGTPGTAPSPITIRSRAVFQSAVQRDMRGLPAILPAQLDSYVMSWQSVTDAELLRIAEGVVFLHGGLALAQAYHTRSDYLEAFRTAALSTYDMLMKMPSLQLQDARFVAMQRGTTPGAPPTPATDVGTRVASAIAVATIAGSLGHASLKLESPDAFVDAARNTLLATSINVLEKARCQDAQAGWLLRLKSIDALAPSCGSNRSTPINVTKLWDKLGPPLSFVASADSILQHVDNGPPEAIADAILEALPKLLEAMTAFAPDKDPVIQDRIIPSLRAAARIPRDIRDARYGDAVVDVSTVVTTVGGQEFGAQRLPEAVTRLSATLADIASAKDDAAFANALDRAIAPIDAYSRKRTVGADDKNFYFTVNAYVGGAAGLEKLSGHNASLSKNEIKTTGDAGIYMPLGAEIGWKRSHLSLFLQIADLGQVANWRLSASDETVTANPPPFQVQSIFSPGAFLIFQVPKLPLSFGTGWSFAPRFREIASVKQVAGQTSPPAPIRADAHRLSIFLAVDVPLLPP